MRLKYVLAAVACLLFVTEVVSGEFYQYTDESGAIRFTDDPTTIPDSRREDVKAFESVESPESGESFEFNQGDVAAEEAPPKSAPGVEATPVEGLRTSARELDAIRDELFKEYNELQKEKEALGPPPPDRAPSGEKADYTYRTTELNRKIDSYRQRSKEFQERVDAFNGRITGR